MKRLLIVLALLSIPAVSRAYDFTETWTTYCDNGVEKVRVTFVLDLWDPIFLPGYDGEFTLGGECGEAPCTTARTGTITPLGGRLYEYMFENLPRSCVGADVLRSGRLWWHVMIEGYPDLRWVQLECEDGPQVVTDTSECIPLPISTSTWGAVKALYR